MPKPTPTNAAQLVELAGRIEAGTGADNALDVLIEVALFKPDETLIAARPNNAGTKVVYTTRAGPTVTHWAHDWTMDRPGTSDLLRARAATEGRDD